MLWRVVEELWGSFRKRCQYDQRAHLLYDSKGGLLIPLFYFFFIRFFGSTLLLHISLCLCVPSSLKTALVLPPIDALASSTMYTSTKPYTISHFHFIFSLITHANLLYFYSISQQPCCTLLCWVGSFLVRLFFPFRFDLSFCSFVLPTIPHPKVTILVLIHNPYIGIGDNLG